MEIEASRHPKGSAARPAPGGGPGLSSIILNIFQRGIVGFFIYFFLAFIAVTAFIALIAKKPFLACLGIMLMLAAAVLAAGNCLNSW